jgi:hypothetical protein
MAPTTKPVLKIIGTDGNAFALLGRAFKAARQAKWSPEQVAAFKQKATSGDYDQLLATLAEYFDVA